MFKANSDQITMNLELNEQQQHQHDGIDDNNSLQHDNDSNNNDSNYYSTATNTTSQIDPQQQQSSSVKVNKKYKYKADRQQSIKWTQEEDISLLTIVHEHGPKNWKKIAELLGVQRTGNVYTHIQTQCNNIIITMQNIHRIRTRAIATTLYNTLLHRTPYYT